MTWGCRAAGGGPRGQGDNRPQQQQQHHHQQQQHQRHLHGPASIVKDLWMLKVEAELPPTMKKETQLSSG